MKGIGLVIQGPIVSYGRNGRGAHIPLNELNENMLVNYDSRQNIQKVIHDFGGLFDEIVISTWEDQLRPGDNWSGAKIIAAPDPGGIPAEEQRTYKYKANNKYRQFIGTRNGILELEKNKNIQYVVKLRTDQYIDLKKLVNSFQENPDHRNSESIFVPVIHPATFMLHDLYFVSHIDTMKRFCDAILAFDMFEFIHSVHREIVLKYAYMHYREVIGVPDSAYFSRWPPIGASAETKHIFSFMFDRVFTALDFEIFKTVIWRGCAVNGKYLQNHAFEQKRSPKTYHIPALVSTDWERFFAFKCKINQECATTVRKEIMIYVGNCVWYLWGRFRFLVNVLRSSIQFLYLQK